MLIMKWKTDNEGRRVAAWEEIREFQRRVPSPCLGQAPENPIQRRHAKGVRCLSSRTLKRTWALIGSLLMLCSPAAAQTTGTLRGTVKDQTGAVMSNRSDRPQVNQRGRKPGNQHG
jgi:hypothetical protein